MKNNSALSILGLRIIAGYTIEDIIFKSINNTK